MNLFICASSRTASRTASRVQRALFPFARVSPQFTAALTTPHSRFWTRSATNLAKQTAATTDELAFVSSPASHHQTAIDSTVENVHWANEVKRLSNTEDGLRLADILQFMKDSKQSPLMLTTGDHNDRRIEGLMCKCPQCMGNKSSHLQYTARVEPSGKYKCMSCHANGSWKDYIVYYQRHQHSSPQKSSSSSLSSSSSSSLKNKKPVFSGSNFVDLSYNPVNVQEWNNTLIHQSELDHGKDNNSDNGYECEYESDGLTTFIQHGIAIDTLVKFGVGFGYLSRTNSNDTEGTPLEEPGIIFPYSTNTIFDCIGQSMDINNKLKYRGAHVFKSSSVGPDRLESFNILTTDSPQQSPINNKSKSVGLFGLSNIPPDATEIILTGREIDAMAVYQATGLPTVSVSTVSGFVSNTNDGLARKSANQIVSAVIDSPALAPQLTPEIIPLLDQFSKINIWFSDDAVGQEYAHQVAQKLGVDRCHIIRSSSSSSSNSNTNTNTNMIGNLKTPLDALQLFENDTAALSQYFKSRLDEAQPLEHEQILRFDSFRDVIQRELANPSQTAGIQSSSFPGLNLLLKGHRRGELTIVSGATGVGKTTILSQLSLDYCSQGVSTLWGSFEIQNKRLAKRMLIQHAKLDLTTDLDQFDNYANQFSRLPLFFLRFFGSTPANEVVNAITHSVDAYDVKHVIIDNLQFMLSGQGRNLDKWDIQDDAIAKLRKLATEKDIHVTLVVHPRKSHDANEPLDIHSVFGSAKVTQEADNVIFIQRYPHQRQFGDRASGANGDDDALNPRAHLRYLDVHKNRFDGTLGKVFLSFNPKTYLASEVSISEIKQLASTSASSSSSSSASRYRSSSSNSRFTSASKSSPSTKQSPSLPQ